MIPRPPSSRRASVCEIEGIESLSGLKAHNAALLSSLDENSSIIAELCQRRTLIAQRLEATHDQLAEEQEARLHAETKVQQLEVVNGDLETKVTDATREAEAATAKHEALEKEHNKTLGDVARLTREGDEVQATLLEAQSTISRLKAELFEKESTSQAASLEVEELKNQVSSQEAKTKVLGDMWETRARLEDEVKTLTTRLEGSYAQVTQLQGELSERNNKVAELEDRLRASSDGNSAKDGEVADLQWRCEAAEEALANLQRQAKSVIKDREDKVRSLEGETDHQKREIESLEQEVQESQAAQGELRSQCAALATRTEKAEGRMQEELANRKKERKRAERAEQKVKELEAALAALQDNLQKAKDGMGMMRTIAKIRADDGQCPVGFDAVGERTLDAVSKSKGRRGSGPGVGKRR